MSLEIINLDSQQLADRMEKLERLAKTSKEVRGNRRSPNTIRGYKADWEDFEKWCAEHGLQSLPATPHAISAYLSDRSSHHWFGYSGKLRKLVSKAPLKLPTLLHRLWGIKYFHRENGFPLDIEQNEIRDVLDGLRNTNTAKEVRKDPLLLKDLRGMVESLPDTLQGSRDRAILLIGFVGALRRSEIAALCVDDLKFVEEGLELSISQSKTGARDLVIPYSANPLTCPVRSLKKWLLLANIPLSNDQSRVPIFRPINRHGQISPQAITGSAIALIVKRNEYVRGKVSESVISGDKALSYAGHSLRAGFVTEAVLKEIPEHLITAQTGHKKRETLEKYIRIANRWKHNAAIKMGL